MVEYGSDHAEVPQLSFSVWVGDYALLGGSELRKERLVAICSYVLSICGLS